MSTLPFAHLHCHSHYSLLGRGRQGPRAVGAGQGPADDRPGPDRSRQPARGAGVLPEGQGAGHQPDPRARGLHRPGQPLPEGGLRHSKEASYHLTLLARNRTGFQNLLKLSSAAFLEGFYFKPRIDKELLAEHDEGLICLSGCVSSELNRTLLAGGEANLAEGRGGRRLVSKTLRRRLLHRDPEQRPGDPARGDGRGRRASPSGWASPWSPPATSTTSTARTPRPRTSCSASTRASSAPTPTGCGWRATSSTSAAPRRCTRRSPATRTPLRADAGDRRQRRHRAGAGQAAFPGLHAAGRARPRKTISRELCLEGLQASATPTGPTAAPTASSPRR